MESRPEKRKHCISDPSSPQECRKVCQKSHPAPELFHSSTEINTDKVPSSNIPNANNIPSQNAAQAIATEDSSAKENTQVTQTLKNSSPPRESVTDKLDISENGSAENRRVLEADDRLPHTGPDDPERPARGYEYCDHTADIQVHAWGATLKEAFEECAVGMFGYMTDISTVEARDTFYLEAEGDDVESLLFHFLDEWLYAFCVEPFFIPNEVNILEFDDENFRIKCEGYGEPFDLNKHPQGTEVKAITYSAMQIVNHDKGKDVYVIVDI